MEKTMSYLFDCAYLVEQSRFQIRRMASNLLPRINVKDFGLFAQYLHFYLFFDHWKYTCAMDTFLSLDGFPSLDVPAINVARTTPAESDISSVPTNEDRAQGVDDFGSFCVIA